MLQGIMRAPGVSWEALELPRRRPGASRRLMLGLIRRDSTAHGRGPRPRATTALESQGP